MDGISGEIVSKDKSDERPAFGSKRGQGCERGWYADDAYDLLRGRKVQLSLI